MLLGAVAEEESRRKSRRVKKAIRKVGGKTLSFKGNKWGRKPIPEVTQRKVYQAYKNGVPVKEIMATIHTSKNGNSKPIGKSTIYEIIHRFKQEEGGKSNV